WRRDRSPGPLLRTITGRDAGLLLAWTVSYLGYLVVVRTFRSIDPIDDRLVVPAGATAVLLGCAVLARGVRLSPRAAAVVLVGALAFAAQREAVVLRQREPRTTADELADSPRLAWIAAHTSPRDLVFGDRTIDVPFYARRRSIAFWTYPGAV